MVLEVHAERNGLRSMTLLSKGLYHPCISCATSTQRMECHVTRGKDDHKYVCPIIIPYTIITSLHMIETAVQKVMLNSVISMQGNIRYDEKCYNRQGDDSEIVALGLPSSKCVANAFVDRRIHTARWCLPAPVTGSREPPACTRAFLRRSLCIFSRRSTPGGWPRSWRSKSDEMCKW